MLIPGIQGRCEWMRPAIRALGAHHRVLTFSLNDIGDDACCFEAWDGLITRTLDEAGAASATFVGVSFGGVVAWRYAARHPARVDGLVLVSAPAPDWTLDARRRAYLRHPILLAPLFAARGISNLLPEIVAAADSWPNRVAVLAGHLARVLRYPASPARMAAWTRAWQTSSGTPARVPPTTPVLLVTGESELDRVVPASSTLAYRIHAPRARHVVLEGTGHIGLVTKPDRFADVVGEFVRNVHQ